MLRLPSGQEDRDDADRRSGTGSVGRSTTSVSDRHQPTERHDHAEHHRSRPRRVRRVVELAPGRSEVDSRQAPRDRLRQSPPIDRRTTPPASPHSCGPSTARWCSSATPTAGLSSRTSQTTPARSSASCTWQASRSKRTRALALLHPSFLAGHSARRSSRCHSQVVAPTSTSRRQVPRSVLRRPARTRGRHAGGQPATDRRGSPH